MLSNNHLFIILRKKKKIQNLQISYVPLKHKKNYW